MSKPKREDIIRMAREAGFQTGLRDYANGVGGMPFVAPVGLTCLHEIEKLVQAAYAVGAAAEREACERAAGIALLGAEKALSDRVLKAIRARGQNV